MHSFERGDLHFDQNLSAVCSCPTDNQSVFVRLMALCRAGDESLPQVMRTHFTDTFHYSDSIMSTMVSQITSLTIPYSTVYSGTYQRKIKSPHHWPLWGEFTGDRWIPRKKGQLRENAPFDDVIMNASPGTPFRWITDDVYGTKTMSHVYNIW